MGWLFLGIAGLFEVLSVSLLKLSDGMTKKIYVVGTAISFGLSLTILTFALQHIPVSIGYGVWTGIGAAGSVLAGMFIFGEEHDYRKYLLVVGIVISIAGLKFFG